LDFAAERFEELDERFLVGAVRSDEWTTDSGIGSFLRLLTVGREDWANRSKWVFGFGDERLIVRTELLEYAGGLGQHGEARYAVTLINGKSPAELPAERRFQLLESLSEALTVYGDDGLRSTCRSFSAHVEVGGELA
jgi:hypothetical protein